MHWGKPPLRSFMKLSISLVICTYNRVDILPRCLAAACRQSIPTSGYEVIVVDNASTDHTRHVVRQLAPPRGLDVQYVYHPVQGLSHARNAGAAASSSPIVAYIDDDAIAAPDLLWRLLRTFEDYPQAACVGGRIDLTMPAVLPRWYSSFFDGPFSKFHIDTSQVLRVADLGQCPYGANFAFRAKALDSIGGFNVAMGPMGGKYSGGDDIDAVIRLIAMGCEIYYNPAAVVRHVILPSRINWAHVADVAREAGRNWAYYEMELIPGMQSLSWDVKALRDSVRRVATAACKSPHTGLPVAWWGHLFSWAKFIRKIEYHTGDYRRNS
jgi:glycosyltransferase involved in cell wall biosynthesis